MDCEAPHTRHSVENARVCKGRARESRVMKQSISREGLSRGTMINLDVVSDSFMEFTSMLFHQQYQ
jgi:hypothetical protein